MMSFSQVRQVAKETCEACQLIRLTVLRLVQKPYLKFLKKEKTTAYFLKFRTDEKRAQ